MPASFNRHSAASPTGPGSVSPAHLSRTQVLYRALWPFWMFQDASTGDRFARAAAERHNRRMRSSLPPYLLRWLLICAGASLVIYICDALGDHVASRLDVFVLLAAGSGLLCAYGICVLFVLGYAYVALCQQER